VVQGNEVKNEDVLQQHKREDAKSIEELATALQQYTTSSERD
jgi:hypothetical protein